MSLVRKNQEFLAFSNSIGFQEEYFPKSKNILVINL
jgi:hypothetical protein